MILHVLAKKLLVILARWIVTNKPHIHAKGEAKGSGRKPEVWEKRMANYPSIWSINEQLHQSLVKNFAFEDLVNKYHFDKDSSLEYIIVEGKTIEGIDIYVHVFSCFCNNKWASKGKPPF